MLYGQGNRANLGPGGGNLPNVVGDPNLGTTPVPQSLFQQPGYPPNGQGGYPYPQQFGHPSMPPGTPFLPNPTQYPGPVQPGPYPATPPSMPPPPPWAVGLPVQLIPGPDIFVMVPGRRGIPFVRGIPDLLSINVGGIHVGLDGIRIGDLIRIGRGWKNIFPHGIDPYDQGKFKNDIERFVNKMLRKIRGKTSKDRLKIFKQIAIASGNNSAISIPGLGGLLGSVSGNNSALSGPGGMISVSGNNVATMPSSSSNIPTFESMFPNGVGVNNMNMGSMGSLGNIPNIPGMGGNMFPGGLFQSNAGFVLPNKAAYLQYNGRNSIAPVLKRKNAAKDDSFFFKIGNNR
jgi:hypothetical protein